MGRQSRTTRPSLSTSRMQLNFLCNFLILVFLSTDTNGERTCMDNSINEPFFVNVGEWFDLTCERAFGENIAWFFNNIPLGCEQEDIKNDGRGVLKFSKVTLEHAGWYTCAVPANETQGRIEIDYLLVVEDTPTFELTSIGPSFGYTAIENSRLELPCVATRGLPFPDIKWTDGKNYIINNSRITVDQNTGSLIIDKVRQSDFLNNTFRCNNDSNSSYDVTVKEANVTISNSPLGNGSAIYTNLKEGHVRILSCTEDDIQSMNCHVRWTKDLNEMACSLTNNCTTNLSIPLKKSSSGFYCCQVIRNSDNSTMFTTCATVVMLAEPNILLPTNVSLPAKSGRVQHLLCQVRTLDNRYTPFNFTWSQSTQYIGATPYKDNNMSVKSISYFQQTTCASQNETIECIGRREGDNETSKSAVNIVVVEVGRTGNILEGPNADFNDSNPFNKSWTSVWRGGVARVKYETVFYIEDKAGHLQQNITLPPFVSSIFISGRMRQTSTGNVSGIIIRYENGSIFLQLCNPFRSSTAWQWASIERKFDVHSLYHFTSSRMIVELAHCKSDGSRSDMSQKVEDEVNGDSYYSRRCFQNSSPSAMFYFDDLHVSYQRDMTLYIAIVVAMVALIPLLLFAIACVSYKIYNNKRRNGDAVMMNRNQNGPAMDFNIELSKVLSRGETQNNEIVNSDPIHRDMPDFNVCTTPLAICQPTFGSCGNSKRISEDINNQISEGSVPMERGTTINVMVDVQRHSDNGSLVSLLTQNQQPICRTFKSHSLNTECCTSDDATAKINKIHLGDISHISTIREADKVSSIHKEQLSSIEQNIHQRKKLQSISENVDMEDEEVFCIQRIQAHESTTSNIPNERPNEGNVDVDESEILMANPEEEEMKPFAKHVQRIHSEANSSIQAIKAEEFSSIHRRQLHKSSSAPYTYQRKSSDIISENVYMEVDEVCTIHTKKQHKPSTVLNAYQRKKSNFNSESLLSNHREKLHDIQGIQSRDSLIASNNTSERSDSLTSEGYVEIGEFSKLICASSKILMPDPEEDKSEPVAKGVQRLHSEVTSHIQILKAEDFSNIHREQLHTSSPTPNIHHDSISYLEAEEVCSIYTDKLQESSTTLDSHKRIKSDYNNEELHSIHSEQLCKSLSAHAYKKKPSDSISENVFMEAEEVHNIQGIQPHDSSTASNERSSSLTSDGYVDVGEFFKLIRAPSKKLRPDLEKKESTKHVQMEGTSHIQILKAEDFSNIHREQLHTLSPTPNIHHDSISENVYMEVEEVCSIHSEKLQESLTTLDSHKRKKSDYNNEELHRIRRKQLCKSLSAQAYQKKTSDSISENVYMDAEEVCNIYAEKLQESSTTLDSHKRKKSDYKNEELHRIRRKQLCKSLSAQAYQKNSFDSISENVYMEVEEVHSIQGIESYDSSTDPNELSSSLTSDGYVDVGEFFKLIRTPPTNLRPDPEKKESTQSAKHVQKEGTSNIEILKAEDFSNIHREQLHTPSPTPNIPHDSISENVYMEAEEVCSIHAEKLQESSTTLDSHKRKKSNYKNKELHSFHRELLCKSLSAHVYQKNSSDSISENVFMEAEEVHNIQGIQPHDSSTASNERPSSLTSDGYVDVGEFFKLIRAPSKKLKPDPEKIESTRSAKHVQMEDTSHIQILKAEDFSNIHREQLPKSSSSLNTYQRKSSDIISENVYMEVEEVHSIQSHNSPIAPNYLEEWAGSLTTEGCVDVGMISEPPRKVTSVSEEENKSLACCFSNGDDDNNNEDCYHYFNLNN